MVIATTTNCIWTVTLATAEVRDSWVTDAHEAWRAYRQAMKAL